MWVFDDLLRQGNAFKIKYNRFTADLRIYLGIYPCTQSVIRSLRYFRRLRISRRHPVNTISLRKAIRRTHYMGEFHSNFTIRLLSSPLSPGVRRSEVDFFEHCAARQSEEAIKTPYYMTSVRNKSCLNKYGPMTDVAGASIL